MLVTRTITIDCEWDGMKGCYIWCTNELGEEIELKRVRTLLFSHHKSSYYGSFIELKEVHFHQAFYLTPWQALDFFANQSQNRLAHFNYTEDCKIYRDMAETLYESIVNGTFIPDFEQWLDGEFGWSIEGKDIDLFAKEWLTASLHDWFDQDPALSEGWNHLIREFPLLKHAGNQLVAANETDWLEKIGWIQDTAPFQVVLRLVEPDVDDEPWRIETILRDKKNEHIIYSYGDKLPIAWRDYVEKVEREQQVWTMLVPWLHSENETMAREITEFQAWSFLTEDSELLLEAGVEIQLHAVGII